MIDGSNFYTLLCCKVSINRFIYSTYTHTHMPHRNSKQLIEMTNEEANEREIFSYIREKSKKKEKNRFLRELKKR